MKRWFQNNIWWVGFVIMLAVALFPNAFVIIGELVVAYCSAYWLQGTLLLIVALLVIIMVRVGKKDNNAP